MAPRICIIANSDSLKSLEMKFKRNAMLATKSRINITTTDEPNIMRFLFSHLSIESPDE